ncbi:hypothetical protein E3T24_13875 [Cryobacterium sp. TmT2-59]|uniref:hypothetical protein n=1 Tax=Cryobacterium sp. TmT2-59 TaxID=1259264 RepID=UPI00106D0FDD|nr:hypothetical protein [Cryobacterium sp. TmT2-59]TFC82135.1 hypothetical protein E3T24_13875 [Cryobacterium sp. TmT2-59]
MTLPSEGSPTPFEFDEDRGFSENITTFLEHVRSASPEMGELLGELASQIVAGDEDRTRMRTSFNAEIARRLDQSLLSEEGGAE